MSDLSHYIQLLCGFFANVTDMRVELKLKSISTPSNLTNSSHVMLHVIVSFLAHSNGL